MTKLVSTHVLVPRSLRRALQVLADRTHIHQSEYLREALDDLLAKYPEGVQPAAATAPAAEELVLRVDPVKLGALKALSHRTRVRQSEFLREAIHDVLQKRNDLPQPEERPL